MVEVKESYINREYFYFDCSGRNEARY